MSLQAGQMFTGLALLALQGVALWLVVEAVYWIYCKVRGVRY